MIRGGIFVLALALFLGGAGAAGPAWSQDHGAAQAMDHAGHGDQTPAMDHADHGAMGQDHDHEALMREAQKLEAQKGSLPVGVSERLGEMMPADAEFTDSEGNIVRLGDLFTRPTMVLPVYYTCPNVCHILQSSFARILPQVALTPGEDIRVISLSFDDRDTVENAARAKRNFTTALGDAFPPQYWKFLVGDTANITRAMDGLGFGFHRLGDDFAHPVVVVAVAPGGKIVRYLYGSSFLPFDVTMAATEAARGQVGLSVKRVLAYCFSYDPEGRRYTFDLMRVAGISILLVIAVVMGILFMAGRKRRKGGEP